MNQVANRSGSALASLQSLRAGLANVAATTPQRVREPYLRMGKDGIWVYGADNIEVEEGSKWAVNPLSLRHGYSCWTNYPEGSRKKNELLGEAMVPAASAKPDRSSLEKFDSGHKDRAGNPIYWLWNDQVSVTLMCISGEDKGTTVLYKTSSVGGLGAMGDLIAAIMAQLDSDPNSPVPVVLLDSDSYVHKNYGKTYTPDIKIVEWAGLPENGMVDIHAEEQAEEAEDVKDAAAGADTPRRRRGAAEVGDKQPVKEQEQKPAAEPEKSAGDVRRRRTRG